jgi:hypothetical protein
VQFELNGFDLRSNAADFCGTAHRMLHAKKEGDQLLYQLVYQFTPSC